MCVHMIDQKSTPCLTSIQTPLPALGASLFGKKPFLEDLHARSTGPKTSAGRAKVAKNAIEHALRANHWLAPDEQDSYNQFMTDLEEEYAPGTATQQILVERIASCTTKLRRLQMIEDARFHKARVDDVQSLLQFKPHSSEVTLQQTEGEGALPPLKLLETLARYQTSLDRQISKAIGELMVLKALEKAVQATLLPVFNPE